MKSKPPRFQKTQKPWKTLGGRKLIDLGEVKLFRDRIESKSGFRTHHLRLSLHDFLAVFRSRAYSMRPDGDFLGGNGSGNGEW